MEQITITRKEFREKISKNPRGFAMVRAMKEAPEKFSGNPVMLLMEELTQTITLKEVEEELFGPEDESHDNRRI